MIASGRLMWGPSGLLLSNVHVHDNHRLSWSSM